MHDIPVMISSPLSLARVSLSLPVDLQDEKMLHIFKWNQDVSHSNCNFAVSHIHYTILSSGYHCRCYFSEWDSQCSFSETIAAVPFPSAIVTAPFPSGPPTLPPQGYRVRVTYRRVTLWRVKVWRWFDAFLMAAIVDALFPNRIVDAPFKSVIVGAPFLSSPPGLRDTGLGLLYGGLQSWFMTRYLHWYLWMSEARGCHFQIQTRST